MLGQFDAVPTLATSDIAKSRDFYENVLGFVPHAVQNEGVIYTSGSGLFMVYPSAFAGTNKATYVSFQIPNDQFDSEIEGLRRAGITLDEFEFADAVWEDGVMHYGEERGVWFRDPDGNILSVETHRTDPA